MRQILSLISAALICLISGGCSHSDRALRQQLSLADSLMADRPDSALAILNRLPADSLRGELKPWYALLTTKARYKNHQDVLDDSLINIAVAHYSGRGDSLEYQSLYYQGVTLHTSEQYEKSLITLYEAYDKAAAASDQFFQAMSARELSGVYYDIDNVVKELEWIEKAKKLFIAAKKPVHATWVEVNIITALIYSGRCNEAMSLINKFSQDTIRFASPLREKLFFKKALAFYILRDYAGAVSVYDQMVSDSVELSVNDRLRYASSLMKVGDCNAAEIILKEVEENGYSSDSIFFLYANGDLAHMKGDINRAYALRSELVQKLFDKSDRRAMSPQTDLLTDTYRLHSENQRLEIERNHLSILLESIICVFLLVIILVGLYLFRLRLKNQKVRHEELVHKVGSLTDDLNFSKLEISEAEHRNLELNADMRNLIARHLKVVESLSSSLYMMTDSKESKLLKKNLSDVLDRFNEPGILEEMIRIIDRNDNGWMSKFREAYPNLSENDLRLAIYLYFNFRVESIILLLEKKNHQGVYYAKSMLKKKLIADDKYEQLGVAAKLGLS